jgi:integrase
MMDPCREACPVFVNRYGDAMTRFGLNALVERYVQLAGRIMPSLTPHTIRHTTAAHLLRARRGYQHDSSVARPYSLRARFRSCDHRVELHDNGMGRIL